MTVRFHSEGLSSTEPGMIVDSDLVLENGRVSEFDQKGVQRTLLQTTTSDVHYTVTAFPEGAGGEMIVTGKDIIKPTIILYILRGLISRTLEKTQVNDVSLTIDLPVGMQHTLPDETVLIGE